ncbi:MAG: 2-oxoglutarate dehydrogenase E1 component [Planctomycetes bacterium]|jgi:2-oxoglutarate dehydrogenase E1 component|nr:2-oxoglutarate dehydrogenase E1 component [Planctomycetota bacterium]
MNNKHHSDSLPYLESLLETYRRSAGTVPEDWRRFLEQFNGDLGAAPIAHSAPHLRSPSIFRGGPRRGADTTDSDDIRRKQHAVDQLVRNYRVRGHMIADLDPLDRHRPTPPELDPVFFGLGERDMDRAFYSDLMDGPDIQTLHNIYRVVHQAYGGCIGVQFMHIDDLEERRWVQRRFESPERYGRLSPQMQQRVLRRLTQAVVFEKFIHKRYLGAKTFSLEGAETLIPLLDCAIDKAADQGVRDIVIGMAHRGRLNVLANILGKPAVEIIREFEDKHPEPLMGGGDVKYHLGYSGEWQTTTGQQVHLSLSFNPSHLEFVDPVVLGRSRARQDRVRDTARRQTMPLLIHGDAAFAGEGVVQETLNLSALAGYAVGGTLHIIVNNQLGFTTPPEQGRSGEYATDVARMLQAPIFHVNGEDPEAVLEALDIAMDFRATFRRDVFIDMYCYRLHGHNEGDEPTFTNPTMYHLIEQRDSVQAGYLKHLQDGDGKLHEQVDQWSEQFKQRLDQAHEHAKADPKRSATHSGGVWADYHGGHADQAETVDTGVDADTLRDLLRKLTRLPDDFKPHRKIDSGLSRRREMADDDLPLDFSAGEALAMATLAVAGHPVRLSGQDSERGTFSQRHAVVHDREDGHPYVPLQHLTEDQASVEVHNSPLSETGVLGFEYGYSLDRPDALVMWEAQFGDFVNAAQVIIDQFIASAEDKWGRLSGLVLLLPHGFEGLGPEHSSARLERWLNLAAEDNIQVVQPTTPAQYFHVLRRQVLRRWRKPLVVLTPKSLLRDKRATSSLDELGEGGFQHVIADEQMEVAEAKRVLLCSGKLYYELTRRREQLERDDVAILRLEQFYPFPEEELRTALGKLPDGKTIYWVQEEPWNMGAWMYLRARIGSALFDRLPLEVVCLPESASPATGSSAAHKLEQDDLIGRAFGGD